MTFLKSSFSPVRSRNSLARLGSLQLPAISAQQLYNAGITTNGTYYIRFPNGNSYPIACEFNSGGGWMNINRQFGQYATALTSAWGTGGGDYLSGVANNTSETSITTATVSNMQAQLGCGGDNDTYRSRIIINNDLKTAFNITRTMFSFLLVSRNSTGECGWVGRLSSVTTVSGASGILGNCALHPNGYGGTTADNTSVKAYGTFSGTNLVMVGTACSFGSPGINGRFTGLWIQ
jgi:hypothetical protein